MLKSLLPSRDDVYASGLADTRADSKKKEIEKEKRRKKKTIKYVAVALEDLFLRCC